MAIPRTILDRFPPLPEAKMRRLLDLPAGKVRMLMDTDTANEIDDQFALTWALLSPERIEIEGVVAEPFSFEHHQPELLEADRLLQSGASLETKQEKLLVAGYRSWIEDLRSQGRKPEDLVFVSPPEGMESSYHEILRVFEKIGADPGNLVKRGSPTYLEAPDQPIPSDAVDLIIERAKANDDRPLYIVAIGCVTNIASALLLAPEIRDNIVVVWTSAFPSHCRQSNAPSLNLVQDPIASQLIFDSGVAHVYLPGYHIGAQLSLSLPEVETFVRGRGAIGDYLHHLYVNNPLYEQRGIADISWRTWVIWDVINVAWLLNPEWVPSDLVPSPILGDDFYWRYAENRHLMREAYGINRDKIFRDLYMKLDNLV